MKIAQKGVMEDTNRASVDSLRVNVQGRQTMQADYA